jgi:pantoate--beta-alanine ligase
MTMPRTVRKTEALRCEVAAARRKGKRIGFVPTMGCLHEGHLSLVREARRASDLVVASIFVNPRQFGPAEDYQRYPRDLRRDRAMLAEAGCDIIFYPGVEEMYPPGFTTAVRIEGLRDVFCGEARPGHFDGVAVVVLKLLLAVMPDVAFFGEKDYQQLVIIKSLARDLGLPIEIVGLPTVRDKDGLALSSRNAYLSKEERITATSLFRSLELARLMIAGGERRSRTVRNSLTSLMVDAGVTKVDYVAVVEPATLEPVPYITSAVRVMVAAWVGSTRLIDNIAVDVAAGPVKTAARLGLVAVILAAGEGKRMKSDLPKVLHTVGGKPMVAQVVRAVRKAGVSQMVAVIGHGSSRVGPVVRRLGVATAVQDVQRGTGHAVLQAFPLLRGFKGDILVVSGDTPLVKASTIKRVLSAHRKHANAITFGTAVVPDPKGYGRIVRDAAGAFERIVEEKDADERVRALHEVNGGMYCFKASALFDSLLMLTAGNSQMEYYITEALDIVKAGGGRVEAVVIDDPRELLGVNTPQELALVRKLFGRRS